MPVKRSATLTDRENELDRASKCLQDAISRLDKALKGPSELRPSYSHAEMIDIRALDYALRLKCEIPNDRVNRPLKSKIVTSSEDDTRDILLQTAHANVVHCKKRIDVLRSSLSYARYRPTNATVEEVSIIAGDMLGWIIDELPWISPDFSEAPVVSPLHIPANAAGSLIGHLQGQHLGTVFSRSGIHPSSPVQLNESNTSVDSGRSTWNVGHTVHHDLSDVPQRLRDGSILRARSLRHGNLAVHDHGLDLDYLQVFPPPAVDPSFLRNAIPPLEYSNVGVEQSALAQWQSSSNVGDEVLRLPPAPQLPASDISAASHPPVHHFGNQGLPASGYYDHPVSYGTVSGTYEGTGVGTSSQFNPIIAPQTPGHDVFPYRPITENASGVGVSETSLSTSVNAPQILDDAFQFGSPSSYSDAQALASVAGAQAPWTLGPSVPNASPDFTGWKSDGNREDEGNADANEQDDDEEEEGDQDDEEDEDEYEYDEEEDEEAEVEVDLTGDSVSATTVRAPAAPLTGTHLSAVHQPVIMEHEAPCSNSWQADRFYLPTSPQTQTETQSWRPYAQAGPSSTPLYASSGHSSSGTRPPLGSLYPARVYGSMHPYDTGAASTSRLGAGPSTSGRSNMQSAAHARYANAHALIAPQPIIAQPTSILKRIRNSETYDAPEYTPYNTGGDGTRRFDKRPRTQAYGGFRGVETFMDGLKQDEGNYYGVASERRF